MIMVYSILGNMQDVELGDTLRMLVDKYVNTLRSDLATFYSGVLLGHLQSAVYFKQITDSEMKCILHDVEEYYNSKYPNYNQMEAIFK